METPVVSIRKASHDDAQGILECLTEAFEAYRGSYTSDAFRDTVPPREEIQNRVAKMWVFVAVKPSGEIVGTVACNVLSPNEGHIRGMAVRTSWHGAHVASGLLRSVESELRHQRCSRVTLDTTLPLKRAMRFYEKQGFQRSGRITNFFGMPLIEYVKAL